MSTRWALSCLRNSKMLRLSSFFILSSMLSRTMNAPVLPTPALQCTSRGQGSEYGWMVRMRQMKLTSTTPFCGTPWSGQPVKWNWTTSKLFKLSVLLLHSGPCSYNYHEGHDVCTLVFFCICCVIRVYRLTQVTVIFRMEYSANGSIAFSVIVRLCPGWMLSPTFAGQYSSHLGYW